MPQDHETSDEEGDDEDEEQVTKIGWEAAGTRAQGFSKKKKIPSILNLLPYPGRAVHCVASLRDDEFGQVRSAGLSIHLGDILPAAGSGWRFIFWKGARSDVCWFVCLLACLLHSWLVRIENSFAVYRRWSC